MMWTFIVVVMLVVLVRARPEGSNSNGNEDAPTDQVKEENEMRQDGLFSSIFKIGKKLLPKVLGHAGHHHDNHDQDYNDGYDQQMKTGAQLRASNNFDATSLTENRHRMRSDDPDTPSNISFPVRLINNGVIGGKSGRLEVFINGYWGTICDDVHSLDNENDRAAKVVCRMLGFSGGEVFRHEQTDFFFGKFDADPILASFLDCTGTEADIAECDMKWTGSTNDCHHWEDIGIKCH